ncbi:7-cyano-7-deazaguanine synthase [Lipingzhangella sp. LS1_29]|uniref:7-cyano-7-deazaguanine synthase n=1 Tax=Lipingzhangella rawalii TaxID=2055835 RepID=A0ABU2H639_9ACTN|nr:7-cyano-7-deazaguanine synthase [Lipingzhangella rawalii]MDS1270766.1 7-cyano-7-deazaguanine synthase [Lipingzhangella rawalii]
MAPPPRATVRYRANNGPQRTVHWGADVQGVAPDLALGLLREGDPTPDLFEIAGACFAVDRAVPRPDPRNWRWGGSEWSRRLQLHIPVRQPEFWQEQRALLERLLTWLTDDDWSLEFTQGAPSYQQTAIRPPPEDEPHTLLFSGGLDSTAGLARLHAEHSRAPLRLASVVTNDRMRNQQKQALNSLYGSTHPDWFPFRLNLVGAKDDPSRAPDSTARTRGFLFLSAGVTTALAHGGTNLDVYENGTGAVNLALSRGQVGAQAARAVHPRTLKLMSQLASRVLRHGAPSLSPRRFHITNPAADTTKAELICNVPEFAWPALHTSVSCDSAFTHGEGGHCGWCSSCVLRRQAMAVAGHVQAPPLGKPPQAKRDHTAAMLWQVGRLRHTFAGGPSWQRLLTEFPDVLCVPGATTPQVQRSLMRLLGAYLREWDQPGVAEAVGFDF